MLVLYFIVKFTETVVDSDRVNVNLKKINKTTVIIISNTKIFYLEVAQSPAVDRHGHKHDSSHIILVAPQ